MKQIVSIEVVMTPDKRLLHGLTFGVRGEYTISIFLYSFDTFESVYDTILEETLHVAIYKCDIKFHHHKMLDRLRAIGAMNPK